MKCDHATFLNELMRQTKKVESNTDFNLMLFMYFHFNPELIETMFGIGFELIKMLHADI
jgi:hypothetical protein